MTDRFTTELENAVEKGLAQGQQKALGQPTKHTGINVANGSAMSTPVDATMADIIDAVMVRNERAKNDLDALIAGLQRLRETL